MAKGGVKEKFRNPKGGERERYVEAGLEECWDLMKKYLKVMPSLEGFVYGFHNLTMATEPEEYAIELIRRVTG